MGGGKGEVRRERRKRHEAKPSQSIQVYQPQADRRLWPPRVWVEAEFSGRWSVDEQKQRMGRITFSSGRSGGWRGTRPREQPASLRLIKAAHTTIHHGQRNGYLLLGHFFLYFSSILRSSQWLSLRSPLSCCPRLGCSRGITSTITSAGSRPRNQN